MRIGLFGGLTVEHDGKRVAVTGAMQLAVLFRLALDAGTAVSYRAIAEDVWAVEAPENTRAALQSIISRLRPQLPPGSIESTIGGYRLMVHREDVDVLRFGDLVGNASRAGEEFEAVRIASEALALWIGEPWVPSEDFDWFLRDLARDKATALALGGIVRSEVTPASNIPAPLTALIGRTNELLAISDQLAQSRLVTIIGPGGAGKTRLALATAADVHGAMLVELAPVGAAELMSAVLAATGREVRTVESEMLSTRDRVKEALTGRPVLLVLDNCEHVIEDVARLAQDLLSALPQLRILSTSREPLGIGGEAFVSIGPLSHPSEADLGNPRVLDEVGSFAAVELFAQRAIAASGRPLNDDELPTAARICIRLDGLPLAIELAAAKLRTMTVDEVLGGLDDRFTLLTGGFRTALPRHQTLRAMIDWSWSLLSADEQRALAHLAVFPAGVAADESGRVAALLELPNSEVFASLVDKSLLQRSRGRYRTLETIREYGVEKLAERGQLEAARQAQVRFTLVRAQESDAILRGREIYKALNWFDAEDDNIAAALRFSTRTLMADEATALVVACAWYWLMRDRQDDARNWFGSVAPLAEGPKTQEAGLVRLIAPLMRVFAREFDQTGHDEETARDLRFIEAGIDGLAAGPGAPELFQVLEPLLRAFVSAGTDRGWTLRVDIVSGEDLGLDPWPCAMLNVMGAAVAQNRGDVPELGRRSELAVAQFGKLGDVWGESLALQMRSEFLTITGRLDEALEAAEQSTVNLRLITSTPDLQQQQGQAVVILVRQGRLDEARARTKLLLAEAEQSENAVAIMQSQIMAARIDLVFDDAESASARLDRVDAMELPWPAFPGQLRAASEALRASIASKRGDLVEAEAALRRASDAAIATQDHPIIGMIALELGALALERGDISEAVRALDLSTAIVGAYDATEPRVVAIEKAAADAGIVRTSAAAPTRTIAIDSLRERLSSSEVS